MREDTTIPVVAKISGLLSLGGFILFAIGLGTHFWSYSEVYGYSTEGLWLGCYKSECKAIFEYGQLPAWFTATQILECLGGAAALAALGFIIIYLFIAKGKPVVNILAILACFAAAGAILLGIIIYGANVRDNLSWSYAFCVIGAIFYGIAGVLLIMAMLSARKKREPESSPATVALT